jgi:hypothetical protein
MCSTGLVYVLAFAVSSPPPAPQSGDPRIQGKYLCGIGSGGTHLSIDDDDSFSLKIGSDVGPLASAEGTIEYENGAIRLVASSVEGSRRGLLSERLVPVPWGDRLYLIGESTLPDFVNFVNNGWEPREEEMGSFLFKEGDSRRSAKGRPELPAVWKRCVLERPLRGRIAAVVDKAEGEVDLGERQGVFLEMLLYSRSAEGVWSEMVVTHVGPEASRVKLRARHGALEVGQEVASSPID